MKVSIHTGQVNCPLGKSTSLHRFQYSLCVYIAKNLGAMNAIQWILFLIKKKTKASKKKMYIHIL